MRVIISLLLVLAVSSELINMGTWIANTDNKFANMTLAEKKKYAGSIIPLIQTTAESNLEIIAALPTNFDSR